MRTNLKNATYKWLYSPNLNYFVTLTFKDEIKELKAKKELDLFCLRFNRLIFGKRSKRKIRIISVQEFTANNNPHFHLLFDTISGKSDEEVKELVLRCWRKSFCIETHHLQSENNSNWFQVIKENTHGTVLSYCLKLIKYDINNISIKHL